MSSNPRWYRRHKIRPPYPPAEHAAPPLLFAVIDLNCGKVVARGMIERKARVLVGSWSQRNGAAVMEFSGAASSPALTSAAGGAGGNGVEDTCVSSPP